MDKQERMLGLLKQAQDLVDAAEAEERNLSDDEHGQAMKFLGDALQVRDEIKTDRRDDELKASLGKLLGDMRQNEPQSQEPQQAKGTLGERFLADWPGRRGRSRSRRPDNSPAGGWECRRR